MPQWTDFHCSCDHWKSLVLKGLLHYYVLQLLLPTSGPLTDVQRDCNFQCGLKSSGSLCWWLPRSVAAGPRLHANQVLLDSPVNFNVSALLNTYNIFFNFKKVWINSIILCKWKTGEGVQGPPPQVVRVAPLSLQWIAAVLTLDKPCTIASNYRPNGKSEV